jgi:SAM-dependent methyltransferase
MPENILLDALEKVRRHPWWLARAKLAVAILHRDSLAPPATILEAGCGWGVNLQALERAGYRVTGLDISRRILERIDRPDRQLIEADLTREFPSPLEFYDGLLALDVIEHLDDDQAAVKRLAKLVRPGGLVVISVPALPELFSDFDEVQGHRRRYEPATLRATFAGSDLALQEVFWWGAWMVPVLRRMRSRSRSEETGLRTYADYLRLPPWPLTLLMQMLFAREQRRALNGKLRTGTSLFAIARRGDGTRSP